MNRSRPHEMCDKPSDQKSFVLETTNSLNHDLEGSFSTTVTLEVMNICKTKIIRPFNIMLTMVGWRPLTSQIQRREKYSFLIKFVDKAILLLIISLMLLSYVYEALSCRYEQNTMDKIVTKMPKPTTTSSIRNLSTTKATLRFTTSTTANSTNGKDSFIMCSHISTMYIIPSIIHLIAYIMGMIHYRFNDNEDIYGLMEKTLQYSATLGTKRSNYTVVIRMLTFWIYMALFWVLLAITSYILYVLAYNTFDSPFYIFPVNINNLTIQKNIKHLIFMLDFLGYLIACVVTVTIVLNYTIYCELVKFYVDAIAEKIEMRCIKVNIIKNDMQTVDGCIALINGMIGKMMTLIFILELNLLIVGIINVLVSTDNSNLIVANRIFFVIHLLPLIITSLIQCVRVNLAMKSFKKWGRHMSVFGYRKDNKKQLDSFLLFTMGYESKVHLMSYPLEWWQLLLFFIILGFVIITLIQTGVMDQAQIFKYL